VRPRLVRIAGAEVLRPAKSVGLRMTTEVKVKINVNVNVKVKGSGRGRPLHTGSKSRSTAADGRARRTWASHSAVELAGA